jgi:hypothetical protein
MDMLNKKLLNSLKCPICRGPIDMLDWKSQKPYDFGCAYNIDHYKLLLNDGYITQEQVSFYDKTHKYIITKSYKDSFEKTLIHIYEADQEYRVQFDFLQKLISPEVSLFDFRNFNVEKALNRLKTYLVFQ